MVVVPETKRFLPPLVRSLERLKSLDGLGTVIASLCEIYELRHASFVVTRAGAGPQIVSFVHTTYPVEWVERYTSKNYFAIDPVIQAARVELLPFRWGRLGQRAARTRSFWKDARSFGIGSAGLTVPVRGAFGERSLFSVTPQKPSGGPKAWQTIATNDLMIFAFHLHDRVFAMAGLRPAPVISLSPQERRCLELICRGLLIKQVAPRLRISESAVRQYLRSAKRKLSARTLSQAASRAVVLDLV